MLTGARIAENHDRVVRRIEAACTRTGRELSSVTLVAVTKYAEIQWVRDLLALGVQDLGESRPQQLVQRVPLIPQTVRWHMIGHLQRNKARRVLSLKVPVRLIHSIDTLRLLATVDRLAEELQLRPRLLLEVNISGEPSKHGFLADQLLGDWETILGFHHVRVEGLMTMAPWAEEPEDARPVFRRLRELRNQLADASPQSFTLPELSMGMSRDFEIAVEEGATIVRIGSELFAGLERSE